MKKAEILPEIAYLENDERLNKCEWGKANYSKFLVLSFVFQSRYLMDVDLNLLLRETSFCLIKPLPI